MQRPWVTSSSYKSAVEVLIRARDEKGLNQREVGEKLGKPHTFVSKIETRQRRIDIVEFIALARAMDIEPTELLTKILGALEDPLIF